ncbi:MAG: molybdopterin molybdenumtransferase MoeA, partial [Aquihabitans sp.]
MLGRCHRLPPVPVDLIDAQGCVLADTVVASADVPPFANSAMDGFAVRAADVATANEKSPVRLRVVGTIAAGAPPDIPVGPWEAVRIMTGAPIPPGADAVVVVERSTPVGDGSHVDLTEASAPGRHIRAAGEDVAHGDAVLPAGTLLGPAHL